MFQQREEFKAQKRAIEATQSLEELNAVLDTLSGVGRVPGLEEIKLLMGKNFLGPEDFSILGEVEAEITPLPVELTVELLNKPCSLKNDGVSKIKDTHIVSFIPETLKGEALTILSFPKTANENDKGIYFLEARWFDDQPFTNASAKGHWVLIPKELLIGFTNKNSAAQDEHLKNYPDYETASTRDVYIAIGMYLLKNGEQLYSIWGSCKEVPVESLKNGIRAGCRARVGFLGNGPRVDPWATDADADDIGRAIVRRFGGF